MKASNPSFGEGSVLDSRCTFQSQSRAIQRLPIIGAAVAVLLSAASTAFGQCQYEVTLIHAPFCPGGWQPITSAEDMSENGVVVGSYEQCQSTTRDEAFMWSQQTGFVTLPRPAGIISARALAISDDGSVIVGQMIKQSGPEPRTVAFVYLDGQMVNLGALPGHHHSYATGVIDANYIVGQSNNVLTGPLRAVRWVNQIIGELPCKDPEYSGATDVNSDAFATGSVGSVGVDSLAATWNQTVLQLLQTTGIDATAARANCNNNSGVVGGAVNINDNEPGFDPSNPMMWRDSVPQLLILLPDSTVGSVLDVAEFGSAGGFCSLSTGGAAVWIGSNPTNLNDHIDDERIVRLSSVQAISEDGRLVVQANAFIGNVNGVVCAVLTPVESIASDLNHDCATDVADLFLLLSEWNQGNSFADINNSGNVDVSDLFLLLAGWG